MDGYVSCRDIPTPSGFVRLHIVTYDNRRKRVPFEAMTRPEV